MIQNDDILNMNFYKKEKFTGSYQGMRYLIQKDQEEDAEDENVKHDIFRVTIWPGPYNFASTADDLKSSAVFPFTPEGKEQVVGWLNEQWSARRTEWPVTQHQKSHIRSIHLRTWLFLFYSYSRKRP